MMASIKARDTAPERFVQEALQAKHISFETHSKLIPGTPDLLLPLYQVALFVNGCFWHRHTDCFYATTPATQKTFWKQKLNENVQRDARKHSEITALGWRVIVIWECGIKHCPELFAEVIDAIEGEALIEEWPEQPPRIRSE